MKRFILTLLLSLCLCGSVYGSDIGLWGATALTGGSTQALDEIDGASLEDGHYCLTTTSDTFYVHRLDASSGAAESSPGVISPDTNAGSKRWILITSGDQALVESASPDFTALDLGGTIVYSGSAITVDTGGGINIDLGGAAGDDFTIETSQFVVESDTGNVGIGTTNPLQKVDVVETGDASVLQCHLSSDYRSFLYLNSDDDDDGTASSDIAIIMDLSAGGQYWSLGVDDSDSDKFKITGTAGVGASDVLTIDTSGNVGIGVTDPDADLEVTDDLHVTDKLTVDGATDPPCVLYDLATRESTYKLIERSIPPEKLGGAAMFFNTDTKRIEIFVASEGKYYDLLGNVLETVDPIVNNFPVKTRARINQDTGEVQYSYTEEYKHKFKLKDGYELKSDGTFLDDKGAVTTKADAVELVDITRNKWKQQWIEDNITDKAITTEQAGAQAEAAAVKDFKAKKPKWLKALEK